MQYKGQIRKMVTDNGSPIQYYLKLEQDILAMNQLIGRKIRIVHDHNQCLHCSQDKEIYRMGYCKSCFFEVPQTNESVIRPELSTAHLGKEQRDLAWEKKFELQPHIVYLAVSSGLKVGVTRREQLPTRWIDQGASYALPFVEVENRYLAGITEVAIAKEVSDKTNYRKMLTNEIPELDLLAKAEELAYLIPSEVQSKRIINPEIIKLEYPVSEFPKKVRSITLRKFPEIEKTLTGIKGQYLIFDDDTVFNVRNHEGYFVKINV